jgi:hypothetical protein
MPVRFAPTKSLGRGPAKNLHFLGKTRLFCIQTAPTSAPRGHYVGPMWGCPSAVAVLLPSSFSFSATPGT